VVIFVGVAIYKLVFYPVSLSFESHPSRILAVGTSPIALEVFPVDRLGIRVPFAHLHGRFVVSEGADKIEVIETKSNELKFKTRGSTGRLVIFYYAHNIPFPIEIILNLENSTLAITNHLEPSFDCRSNA